MIPDDAAVAADVYKHRRLAGRLWRVADEVTFAALPGPDVPAVATTLPAGTRVTASGFRLPAFFAGLLPEGRTRRRVLARALHVAEDDDLGLLALTATDTIGDVQIVPVGTPLPEDWLGVPQDLSAVFFAELWEVPDRLDQRASLPGVQPKISYPSRSLIGGGAGRVILKLVPDPAWRGVLENEALFTAGARRAGLRSPVVSLVRDREGVPALVTARFDRSTSGRRLPRHAQEDAAQVLGLQPAQKYDPDARQVIRALADACAAPPVARRDLLHQLLYGYAIGNNDVHAKNLSIGQDPDTGLWSVTSVYDVLHTWPYESDHRFHPAVRDRPHDSVTRRHWHGLGEDLALPAPVVVGLIARVVEGVGLFCDDVDAEQLGMPEPWVRDVRRRIRRRLRDLQ